MSNDTIEYFETENTNEMAEIFEKYLTGKGIKLSEVSKKEIDEFVIGIFNKWADESRSPADNPSIIPGNPTIKK